MKPPTIGELYGPAMTITDQAEADAYLESLIALHQVHQPGDSRAEAERVQRLNLGYYAGYYDHETRQRVERLFRCVHPIFGPAGEQPVAPEEAFRLGMDFAAKGGA